MTLLDSQYGRNVEYRSTSAIIEYIAEEGYGRVRDALSVCVGGVMKRRLVEGRFEARGTKMARGGEIRRAFMLALAVVDFMYAIVSVSEWQLCELGSSTSWASAMDNRHHCGRLLLEKAIAF